MRISQQNGPFPPPALAEHTGFRQPSPGLPKDHPGWNHLLLFFLGSRLRCPFPFKLLQQRMENAVCGWQIPEEWSSLQNAATPVTSHKLTEPPDVFLTICRVRVPLSLRSPGKTLVLLFIIFSSLGTHKNLFHLFSPEWFADSLKGCSIVQGHPFHSHGREGGHQVF